MSIIGLGWFGSAFAEASKGAYEVQGTTRSEVKKASLEKSGLYAEVLSRPLIPSQKLLEAEIILLNIPPFEGQLDWFKSWKWNKNSQVIFISSTSVYGEVSGPIDEDSALKPATINAEELVRCEEWFLSFPHHVIIRFGGLLGASRHPGNTLSGKKNLKGGQQAVNLIHLDDTIGFTKLVIEKKIKQQVFNLVAPFHPTRRDYYQNFCRDKNLPLPEFDPSDASEGKIVSHEKVSRIYQFKNPELI